MKSVVNEFRRVTGKLNENITWNFKLNFNVKYIEMYVKLATTIILSKCFYKGIGNTFQIKIILLYFHNYLYPISFVIELKKKRLNFKMKPSNFVAEFFRKYKIFVKEM